MASIRKDKDKERAKKILTIALDMHQPKEMRIQAVRVLKAMRAIDELWTVVHNINCPFTRQTAIDCIPALEFKGQKTQVVDQVSLPEAMQYKQEVTTPSNKLELP